MWDTQHAVLFCQSLCMSSFELRLSLPCSQAIWEASDAASWAAAWRSSDSQDDKTSYLVAVKSYLTPQGPRPTRISAFSRVLILHGLMSVAWDMERRQQTALGVVSEGAVGWRHVISTAYDAWKSDFDAYCSAALARNKQLFQRRSAQERSGSSQLQEERDGDVQSRQFLAFAAAYSCLYHAAQAQLNMQFLDVQIYAGARHIVGRPVQQKDYIRSSRIVKRWASTSDSNAPGPSGMAGNAAARAAWHASRLLLDATSNLTDSETMGLFHVPWCLYLATLTCWAVHHARPSRELDDDVDGDDEIVWDPEGDMRKVITEMARAQTCNGLVLPDKRRTTGLVRVMAEVLTKVRWGIIRAGVVVLRGLVPQRLINQYEDIA